MFGIIFSQNPFLKRRIIWRIHMFRMLGFKLSHLTLWYIRFSLNFYAAPNTHHVEYSVIPVFDWPFRLYRALMLSFTTLYARRSILKKSYTKLPWLFISEDVDQSPFTQISYDQWLLCNILQQVLVVPLTWHSFFSCSHSCYPNCIQLISPVHSV